MSGIDDYLGAAGDMFSGSQDPDEQNRALEREAARRRREQEREQARLLKEQQAAQAELQKSLQQPALKPLQKPNPDDPVDGVPEQKQLDILLHKYDTPFRKPNDYLGGQLSQDKQNEYIDVWKNRVKGMSPDMRSILLQQNMNRHPDIKEEVEQAKREFQQWLPQPKAQTLEFRLDSNNPENIARTTEYRPERDGPPHVQNALLTPDQPVHVVPANNNLFLQAASVNDPQDQSVTPLYRALLNIYGNAFGPDKAVTGYGRSYPTHTDQSYGEAEKMAGRAAVRYINKGLGPKSTVYGIKGNRTVGEPDKTTGKLLPAIFQNINNKAVAQAQEDIGLSEGFRYDPKFGSRQAFSFEKGIDKAILEGKTSFYSFASLTGEGYPQTISERDR